jgi:hypothetical protein
MGNRTPKLEARAVGFGSFGLTSAPSRPKALEGVYVTRRPEEKYHESCCVPKLRTYSSWTIHGSISVFSKGPMVVMEKEWGRLTGKGHRERVLPWVYYFMDWVAQHPENRSKHAILMEDGASPHTAKLTKQLHDLSGIDKMCWPANSPDLNPIENVWRLLKQRVAKRDPRTRVELRQCVEKEWLALEISDFAGYIGSMNARCQAVIDAKGCHMIYTYYAPAFHMAFRVVIPVRWRGNGTAPVAGGVE